jgi:hypothetical protein
MPTTDRRALKFAEAIQDNFDFLSLLGFKRVQSEPTFVRFESKRVFVNVYHDRLSYELWPLVGTPSPCSKVDPEAGEDALGLVELQCVCSVAG